MIFSVLVSSALLLCSASASSPASNNKQELGSSESSSRGYSSHPAPGPPPAAYEPREPEAVYSKGNRGYDSSEDTSAQQEDYVPKAPAKKTVILAIPVKLALQQTDREKSSSYESSGESYGNAGAVRHPYPTSYTSYADQQGSKYEPAGTGSSNHNNNNAYNSNNNNNQYEYTAAPAAAPAYPNNQNSQLNYNQQPPAYAASASASQGYTQSSPPLSYLPVREAAAERPPLRTYTDKSPPPKPYQPDNDVDSPHSYTTAPSYEYAPKLSRPSSYATADDSSYEVEEHPRPRKTVKRPAAYVEESVDDESYSRPSPRLPSKYLSSEPESDSYPGLDGSTSYQQELSDIAKTSSSSLPSYGAEGLDDADYTSLGLQAYSSPSLPQSELSYLMSKMPRGFSPVPAASSYGLELPAPRMRPYPFGLPSRHGRRPYAPAHFAPAPYLKSPYPAAYAAPPPPKMYMPAASYRHYSATPYYGAASSPVPASSPFRLSSAMTGGLGLGKSFGSGKGLRIGPLEFASSGSLFPSIKIKSPVRV